MNPKMWTWVSFSRPYPPEELLKAFYSPSPLQKSDAKFWIFWIWTCILVEKEKSKFSDEKLDLVFLHRKRMKWRFWVHPILKTSKHQGEFHGLSQDFKLYHGRFRAYFRISVGQFELLLLELGPHFRQKNNFREPIEPKQHLSVSEVK